MARDARDGNVGTERGRSGLPLLLSAAFFVFTGLVSVYQLWIAWAAGTVWIGGGLGGGDWHSYARSQGEYWLGVGIWTFCLAGSIWLGGIAVRRLFIPRS
ncbi:hypothetical protein GCM10007301_00690 [Azorhizobium oxalatiphilum]|uniref:Transmembrane protein n=1 Tax=Azorhizobium oxalatiphilum TaxID=980631 RepID=A0A917F5C6_9HYPH|nr:hypothetical protein [Azorhizobium oxalatiphilum]GGF45046.1 hypothetical protein GCM10007301_00690 [Azorhizobium oxalatiphilum]